MNAERRRIAARVVIAVVWVGITLSARLGRAQQESPVEVRYEGPERCGNALEVKRKISTAWGGEALSEPPLTAHVTVTGSVPELTLHFESRQGEVRTRRRLQVDSCDAATEAAALLVVLALDPTLAGQLGEPAGVEEEPEPLPEPTPPPVAEPEQQPNESVAAASEPPIPVPVPEPIPPVDTGHEESSVRLTGLTLGTSAMSVSGLAPELMWGAELYAGTRFEWLELGLALGWTPEHTSPLPGVDGGTVVASLFRARALASLRFETGRVTFGPYVGIGMELLSAEARDISAPGSGYTQWAAGHGGALVNVLIFDGWSLGAGLGAVLSFERPRYFVADVAAATHRPGVLGVDGRLGVFWSWDSQN